MPVRVFCFWMLLLLVQQVSGNVIDKRDFFTRINIPEAISDATKTCFFQDYRGFVWIGTEDGLIKWDGRQALSFHNNEIESRRITGSQILSVLQDEADSEFIWVLASEGLCKISVVFNKVMERYPIGIAYGNHEFKVSTQVLKTGNLFWLGNYQTLCVLDIKKRKMECPLTGSTENGLGTNNYTDLIYRDGNLVWVFFRNQDMAILDANTAKVLYTHNLSIPGLNDNNFYKKFLGVQKSNDGQYRLITAKGMHTILLNRNQNIIKMNVGPGQLFPDAYAPFKVCLQASSHQLYLSGDKGIYLLDVPGFQMQRLLHNQKIDKEDWALFVTCSLKDRDDNIWFGSSAGIYVWSPNKQIARNFRNGTDSKTSLYRVFHIFPYNQKQTIVGDIAGLHWVDNHSGNIKTLFNDGTYFFVDTFFRHHFIASNTNRTFLFSGSGNRKMPSDFFPELYPLNRDAIHNIIKIDDNRWLFASELGNGLFLWDIEKRIYKKIEKDKFGNSFLNKNINGLKKISGNRVIILSEFEFSVYDYLKDSIANFSHTLHWTGSKMGVVMDVLEFGSSFWFACYGNGIVKCNSTFQPVKFFSRSQGLGNQAVYRIERVDNNFFVISSNSGLYLMDTQTERLTPINKSDGLVTDQYEEGASASKFNSIYMGGYDGFSIIDRNALKIKAVKPFIYLNTVMYSKDGNNQPATLKKETFVIPSNPDEIELSLNIIDYFPEPNDSIEYRILPYQKNWQKKPVQNNLNLIGIPHGDYELELRAVKKFSDFSEVARCSFIIKPAWYQTIWFYLLCLIAAAALVYGIYRYHISQLQKEFRFKEKIAADLHDDLGGTITGIKMFTELGVSTGSPEYYTPVKQGLTEAAMAIREMIWVLDDKTNSIAGVIQKIEHNHQSLLKTKSIHLQVDVDAFFEKIVLKTNAKRDLYLIFKEFINNSLKYSECNAIHIKTVQKEKRQIIEIADNGKGFDLGNSKLGNGLFNMQERAKRMGYDAKLTSAPGKGTTLSLEK